ncbi:MAG: winged helix-turn-helix domain-containing protein [Dehalococcoidia bacterium]|nr:winged helix-turn-helix domain-containing protein [Dehalococcoidia bacterium]
MTEKNEKKTSMDKLFADLTKLQEEAKTAQETVETKRAEIAAFLGGYGFAPLVAKKRTSGPRAPKGVAAKTVLAFLAPRNSATTLEIRAACDMTSGQAQPVLTSLVKKGLVKRSDRGSYEITELGKKEQ